MTFDRGTNTAATSVKEKKRNFPRDRVVRYAKCSRFFPLTIRPTLPPSSITIRLINEQWWFENELSCRRKRPFDAIETFQNGSSNNRVLSGRANMTD